MQVIDPGHEYLLAHLDGEGEQKLTFVKRLIVEGRTDAHEGTNCQEVIRVLIDRVEVLNAEIEHQMNTEILYHLRSALIRFELRALIRKVDKCELYPEDVQVNPKDGHFKLIGGLD